MSVLRDHAGKDSSGRVIAIGLSIVVAFRLSVFTFMGLALGWPDAFVVVIAFMSIPLYHLFSGGHGATLAGKLFDKLGVGSAGVNATKEVVSTTVKAAVELVQGRDADLGIQESK